MRYLRRRPSSTPYDQKGSEKPTVKVRRLPTKADPIWDCGMDVVKIIEEYLDS